MNIVTYIILLTKTTAARNGVALSYHSVRGLHFLAVVFVRSIVCFKVLLYRIVPAQVGECAA